MHTPPRIVVVGGGYAGVMAARAALERRAQVTLVDADGHHGFLPRLATVAAGVGPESDADAPLAELLPGVTLVTDDVAGIDHHARALATAAGRGVEWDALVLAAGAHATAPPIPGLADHAWTLRTPEDARRLRALVPRAESLVVVGAGSTGTQLAGEVAAAHPHVQVHLLEMADRILPSLPDRMADRAHHVLVDRRLAIRTGVSLDRVGPEGDDLDDGTTVPGLVVWTGGYASNGNVLLRDAPTTDGRIVVDRCARVSGHRRILAAGDIAAHRGPGGRLLPQTAQVAVRAGRLAGANAARIAEGLRPRAARLRHIGWVLPLGDGQAVAQVGPLPLTDPVTGRLAPLLHDAIDVRHLLNVGGLPAAVRHHQEFVSLH